MLDIHTVGAGGGSIARVDAGGSLRVGPESAGAVPGPACYGVGEEATVTDAHVVLGHIGQLAGGTMPINIAAAEKAVAKIATKLGLSTKAAAAAIIRVVNSNMERAIRAVSVERGEDPREFPLVAFGGCGGLHACDIARELGIKTVIVPKLAGALSALGMLLADRTRDYSGRDFKKLEKQARADVPKARLERFADMRYAGQSYELTVPWGGDFHAAHKRVYGYSDPKRPVETVTLRVRAVVKTARPWMQVAPSTRTWSGGKKRGPSLIADYGSTTIVPEGWTIREDESGSLLISSGSR
jgi:N-methylhydantoinase A